MERKPNAVLKFDNPSRPVLRCNGCGFEEEVHLPLPVTQFADISMGFGKRHEECKKDYRKEEPCPASPPPTSPET